MARKLAFTAFEDTSILRKLTILYFIISIIPVGVLYYLYIEIRDYGTVKLTEENFSLTLGIVVIGVAVGYFALRSLIKNIVSVVRENKKVLEDVLGPGRLTSLTKETNNEVEVLTQSFNEVITHLEENVKELARAKKTLHTVLSKVGEGLTALDNIDNFLNLILETVTEALHARCGVMLLKNEKKNSLDVKVIIGKSAPSRLDLDTTHPVIQKIISSRKPMVLHNAQEEAALAAVMETPSLCAPLLLHDEILGIISVSGKENKKDFSEDELNLFYNLALQTAVAIENARLNDDKEKTYFETIAALALAVEARDPYSRGHLERVAKLVVMIAKEEKMDDDEIHTLRDAARLHDIGKIGITDQILSKEGPLNPQEQVIMRRHCEIGEGIIKPIRSLENLCDLVRHHHEKLDGSGYPDKLKGDEIHPLVRILTVADIYDALTSNRPYRQPFSKALALDELRKMKNAVDQKYVETLARLVI